MSKKNIRFTANLMKLLKWLSGAGSLTAKQLCLVIGISYPNTRRLLSDAKSAGYISSSFPVQGVHGETVKEYFISRVNLKCLVKAGVPEELRSSVKRKLAAVRHRRAINDVWVSLNTALANQTHYTLRFAPHYKEDTAGVKTCVSITGFTNARITTPSTGIADATILFQSENGSSLTYLEIDTGAESIISERQSRPTLQRKMEMYTSWHDSNSYQQHADMFGVELNGFRVLLITISRQRIQNIQSACSHLGSVDFLWFTTFSDVTPDRILSPIWLSGHNNANQLPLLKWRST